MKISKATAPHYHWGAMCDGWFLENSPKRTVIHERMPPGTAEARHFHRLAKQFFFILGGIATMEIEGKLVTLHPQEGVTIEAGFHHHIRNESNEAIEFLVISSPSTHGDRFASDAAL
ncbi:cupin domain-containing protein [Paenibacillus sp. GP183]|uniref:cupin domain-containing protein n=1 Tax=Paenibacillus sp. GP183 TaxID=1882751 RepID=UPI000896080E|nr:cupin domain-containing protein [Paenibacillus sp. GP183]SEC30145.1 Mannose-6-phosphate isomerase, cupin superfamily [Paenibacillus sp. GP183]